MSDLDLQRTKNVLNEILQERIRQHYKWGEQNFPNGTGDPSMQILAEQAKRVCDKAAQLPLGVALTWQMLLQEEVFEAFAESDPEKLYQELIQVAAVACQWAECIRRKQGDL